MDPRCSEVEVKVLDIGNSQVKYKYLKIVLKYSTNVNVLSYFTPLDMTHCELVEHLYSLLVVVGLKWLHLNCVACNAEHTLVSSKTMMQLFTRSKQETVASPG